MTNTENRDLQWYQSRIEYLAEFVTEERFVSLQQRLDGRTEYITICTENTFHPQNASALVRNCEAFGVQKINTVETLCRFRPNVNIVKGSDKWVDIERHRTTADAVAALRAQGYRIIVTMPSVNDTTPETFDVEAGRFALVFGTEHAGVTQEVVDCADGFIMIPMCGFVESLNVSASAAILLYNLTRRIKESENIDWSLGEQRKAQLLYEWLIKTVKDSKGVMSRFKER